MPGNVADFDYYHGVGRGGEVDVDGNGGEGSPGAAVIIARVPGTSLPSQAVLFFTGKGYHVPTSKQSGILCCINCDIEIITILCREYRCPRCRRLLLVTPFI